MPEDLRIMNKEEIEDLLSKGLIRPSKSPWSCVAFYVNNRNEQVRAKVGNQLQITERGSPMDPVPNRQTLILRISAARIFSQFDQMFTHFSRLFRNASRCVEVGTYVTYE